MKKRTMKKWIPNNTCYCYKNVEIKREEIIKIKTCKWHRISERHREQENGYCIYLGYGDWQQDETSLLWDKCKECGIKDR